MQNKGEAAFGTTVQTWFKRVLIFLPFLLLALMAASWLRVGIDLPLLDDWRDYMSGTKGSFALDYLFLSANDTMYPFGKFLDSVAERLLDGNGIAYQLLSMVTVLGLVLWFQWLLLSELTEDRFVAACSFVATVFALQTGTYWGEQNLAYHQAIPVVCMLVAAYFVASPGRAGTAKLPILFLLGLIAGFSYISGAFPFLIGALVLIVLGFLVPGRRDLLSSGTALGLAAAITSVAQAYVILVRQGGRTHRSDAPWVTPLSPDFWLYFLGKIGRSLALPTTFPVTSLVITLLVVAAALFLIGRDLFRTIAKRDMTELAANRLIVVMYLASIVAVYLAMISASRANLDISPDASLLKKYIFGFGRFHFFWITIIWPWILAIIFSDLIRIVNARTCYAILASVSPLILIIVAISGKLNYFEYFNMVNMRLRVRGLECIQQHLLTSDQISCPTLYPADLTKGYAFAITQGSSFVRSIPPTLAKFNPSPKRILFALAETPLETITIRNAVNVAPAGQVLEIEAANDVQMILPGSEAAANCHTVLLQAVVDGAESKPAEFYYMPAGSKGFSGKYRVSARYSQGSVELVASSAEGFESSFRFDPVTQPGAISVKELTIRCLVLR